MVGGRVMDTHALLFLWYMYGFLVLLPIHSLLTAYIVGKLTWFITQSFISTFFMIVIGALSAGVLTISYII